LSRFHRLFAKVEGLAERLQRGSGRRPAVPPPHPDEVKRQMLGQAMIDGLLQISGPLSRPVQRGLESLWLELLSQPALSRAAGWLADRPLPRPVLDGIIDAWVQFYGVELADAEVPPDGFPTLDAFFTRPLKPGLRPIDPRPGLVSPADSVLKVFGEIDARGRIPEVKGRSYGVSELIGSGWDPADFIGGTFGVYYLSPRDYHRVHAPVDATLTGVTPVAGRTYPVNALGVRRVDGLFARNKRVVFRLETAHGPVALVMVGATNVGRITASASVGSRIEKGQELGIFHLGSTVVLLTTKAAGLTYDDVHEGEFVRVGQRVLGSTTG